MKDKKHEEYQQLLKSIHKELGIPNSYEKDRGLVCQTECLDLVECELDVFSRQVFMEQNTHEAWQKMKHGASQDNIELLLISAYRSAQYQKSLLLNKLNAGQSLPKILKVNAAPGYSEHHSGQALDIGSSECEHLSEEFENTESFQWLSNNAMSFGFSLSFPRNNPQGFLYEPWHWKFT